MGQIFQRLRIAVCLKKGLRKADCLARYGNEEFAIILPEASIEGAIVVAERLREKIKSHNIVYKDNTISLTMSFGVGGMP
jgi:diguanylate cyclase (GGDEF)-like protein